MWCSIAIYDLPCKLSISLLSRTQSNMDQACMSVPINLPHSLLQAEADSPSLPVRLRQPHLQMHLRPHGIALRAMTHLFEEAAGAGRSRVVGCHGRGSQDHCSRPGRVRQRLERLRCRTLCFLDCHVAGVLRGLWHAVNSETCSGG